MQDSSLRFDHDDGNTFGCCCKQERGPHPGRSTNSTRKLHPSRPNQACLRKRIQSAHACSSTDLHCRRDTQNLHSSSRNRHFVSTLLAGHGLQAEGGHTQAGRVLSPKHRPRWTLETFALDLATHPCRQTQKNTASLFVANFFTHRRGRRARE